MAKPLSEDLRTRVVQAVEDGMSRRAAAERFGISVSSAVRFVKEWRESGATKAKRLGGDQRSQRIEEHHEAIMNAIEAKPDMTLIVWTGRALQAESSEQWLVLRFCSRPLRGADRSWPSWISARVQSHSEIGPRRPVGSPDHERDGETVFHSSNPTCRPRRVVP